uniref:Secreted protein n=1 Tax=Rhizochromulina marina TaxID=1034831 RepID=A0A7S2RQW6_9STRA
MAMGGSSFRFPAVVFSSFSSLISAASTPLTLTGFRKTREDTEPRRTLTVSIIEEFVSRVDATGADCAPLTADCCRPSVSVSNVRGPDPRSRSRSMYRRSTSTLT